MRASVVESPGALNRFATTRWRLIRQRRAPGAPSQVDPGLAQLCQIYWRPIFTFILRRGYSAHDAQDLTQDFFVTIMEGNLLQSADPERGRFRSLLLRSLKNFLIDVAAKRSRHKRGGNVRFVSWDNWLDYRSLQQDPRFDSLRTDPELDTLIDGLSAKVAELRTNTTQKIRIAGN